MTTTSNVIEQAEALLAQNRPTDALALTGPIVGRNDAPHGAFVAHAVALKALGRREEALTFNVEATRRFPQSGVAWHNLAATLGDLGRGEPAKAAAETAFSRGLDNPETWGVYARAFLATGELDQAERAYQQALLRAPAGLDTAAEYANLIWMRRGDMAAAQAVLDKTFHAGAPPASVLLVKAKLLDGAGDLAGAARLLGMAVERIPGENSLLITAAQAHVETGQVDAAQRFVEAALALYPNRPETLNQAAIVHLAAGRADQALAAARRGLEIDPDNQSLWGWAATAARAAGDPLYGEVYDYATMVRAYDIEAPAGWATLADYLKDLAATLHRMHPYGQHPFHQSLRHGSQTMQPLAGSTEPTLRAFFQAIDKPIREHMAWLGRGSDPHRRRNTGEYRIDGAWSVSLRPGGFHKDHFHPQGWLSSAFYVETPDRALDADDRQGWIRFGRPPLKLDPPMEAAHYVRPQPGRLVLFPSYMWHGTVPFGTAERRMTIAFDAVPA